MRCRDAGRDIVCKLCNGKDITSWGYCGACKRGVPQVPRPAPDGTSLDARITRGRDSLELGHRLWWSTAEHVKDKSHVPAWQRDQGGSPAKKRRGHDTRRR